MTAAELRFHAPRLCRAYEQLLARLDLAAHQNRVAGDELLSANRCLAHRELQVVRAGNTRSARYNRQRHEKLAEIRERRARADRQAREARTELERSRAAVRGVDEPHRPTPAATRHRVAA